MKALLYYGIILILAHGLAGCDSPSSGSKKIKKNVTLENGPSDDHLAYSDFPFSLKPDQIASINTSSSEGTWEAINLPEWLSLNTQTGELTGVAPESGIFPDIKIFKIMGSKRITVGPFTVRVKNDPLFNFQWNLKNSGQTAFSASSGLAGEDINIFPVYQGGYSGKGILIGVSDMAAETTHEDLANNFFPGGNRDYLKAPKNGSYSGTPIPQSDLSYAHHGTAVAGIIGAVGWNGLGLRGVAPLAKLSTMNFIESDQSVGKLIDQVTGPYDVVNQSWGVSNDMPTLISTDYLTSLKTATSSQRSGKGTIIVKAAGNGYQGCGGLHFCSENSNQDQYNSNPYTIIVGAFNALGKKASYSSVGSNLWISAPGGEFGDDAPAIVSTDLSTCANGASVNSSEKNSFENGKDSLNFTCNYTSSFNGTSAAAPSVSGAVALLLEANPNLKWRDVKHILAATARKIDPDSETMQINIGTRTIDFSLGWITNAAGFNFHNNFGFGAIDVDKAVAMAKNFNNLPAANEISIGTLTDLNELFGPSVNPMRENSIKANFSKTIETIELNAKIEHSYFGDISIEVISPSGTRSILLTPMNTFSGMKNATGDAISSTETIHLLSNAFYGENSQGIWIIKIYDYVTGDDGKIIDLELKTMAR